MTADRQGITFALIAAIGMGTMAIFAKMAYSLGATPLTMLTIRFGLGSSFLWVYLYYRKQAAFVNKKQLFALIVLGLMYGLMSFLFFTALRLIPASMASLLLYTAPILVVIITVLIGDEKLTLHKIVAVTLASLGLYLVLGLSIHGANPWGIAIGLTTGFCYALFIVGSNRWTVGINPLLATAYVTTTTFILQSIVSILLGQLSLQLPPLVWVYAIIIAFFSTALAIGCLYKSIQLIGASRASIVTTMEPVTTVALATIVFNEHLSSLQLLGGALILGAIVFLQLTEVNTTQECQKQKADKAF